MFCSQFRHCVATIKSLYVHFFTPTCESSLLTLNLQICSCYMKDSILFLDSILNLMKWPVKTVAETHQHLSGVLVSTYVDSRNMHLFKWSWSWPRRCSSSPYVISLAELSSSFSCWNCADSSVKSVGFSEAHLSQQRSGEPTQHAPLHLYMWVRTSALSNNRTPTEGEKKASAEMGAINRHICSLLLICKGPCADRSVDAMFP